MKKYEKNTYGEKYQACELCSRGQEPAGVVYITKKSNRFHNRESRSALKRSVRMVKRIGSIRRNECVWTLWMRGEAMSRGEICMMAFLGINTWTDIRKKEICFPVFCLFLAGGILWRITEGSLWPNGLISMGIGIFAAIISALTGGEIGAGDGLPYNSNGVCDDSRRADRNTFCRAFAVWDIFRNSALVLKKQRDIEIPFVPFLLAGYLGGVFL